MAAPSTEKQRVVCVFCGSNPGSSQAHVAAARRLAEAFHKENVKLVYGGGTRGIMGEIARRLVQLSGPEAVHGVIPHALVRVEEGYQKKNKKGSGTGSMSGSGTPNGAETGSEEAKLAMGGKTAERVISAEGGQDDILEEYGTTTLVPDMHTRKRIMANEVINGGPGSGFVVLPGGFGTMEEAFEMITWNQLGIHQRGIVFLNVEGYYDGIFEWVKKSVEEDFVQESNKDILVKCEEPEQVLDALMKYKVSEGRMALDWSTVQA
ncbi:hypothetical protein VTO42DRAFT_732 [Malbranchea cinnamomea]